MRTSTVFKTNVVRRDVNVVTGKSRLVSYHDPQTPGTAALKMDARCLRLFYKDSITVNMMWWLRSLRRVD